MPHGSNTNENSLPSADTSLLSKSLHTISCDGGNGMQLTLPPFPMSLTPMVAPSTATTEGGEAGRLSSADLLSHTSSLSQQPPTSAPPFNGNEHLHEIVMEGKRVIREFLQSNKCHELIRNSSKIVVFDVSIPLNLAFFALVEHDIKAAPLWNFQLGRFVGIITETDFIYILRHLRQQNSTLSKLAEFNIAQWQTLLGSMEHASDGLPTDHMISISPDSSLFDACCILDKFCIHRLPVLDIEQNSVLTILTRSSILEYLVGSFREQRRLFDQTIYDLGIGTYQNIITVRESMPLITVLHLLLEKKIGSIPVVDENGVVTNILCTADITELAKEHDTVQLDMPVIDLLNMQSCDRVVSGGGDGISGLFLCYRNDSLHILFEKFAAARARRLVCVDDGNRVVGVVSLSDLFHYFLE